MGEVSDKDIDKYSKKCANNDMIDNEEIIN